VTKAKRILTTTLVGVAAALSLATPASAEPVDTTFLNALNNAGIGYGDAASTEKLGQSVCPSFSVLAASRSRHTARR